LVLDRGGDWGWGSTNSIISYIISIITLIIFIFIELREKEPVVDLEFFKIPAFTIANLSSFISMMGLFGGIFLIPIFAQNVLGYSVTKSGYLFIPMAVGIMVGAQIGARLAQRISPRYFVSLGMFWGAFMLYLMSGLDIKWGFWDIGLRLALFAFGIGLGFGPLTQAAVSTVPIAEVGVASSVLALSRNLAGAFGTAIFATILSNSITSRLISIQKNTAINTTNPQLLKLIPGLMEIKATILAYGTVFKWAAVCVIIGGIATLFLKDVKHVNKPSATIEV
jgi:predicted MFS family arabinose efflux permease